MSSNEPSQKDQLDQIRNITETIMRRMTRQLQESIGEVLGKQPAEEKEDVGEEEALSKLSAGAEGDEGEGEVSGDEGEAEIDEAEQKKKQKKKEKEKERKKKRREEKAAAAATEEIGGSDGFSPFVVNPYITTRKVDPAFRKKTIEYLKHCVEFLQGQLARRTETAGRGGPTAMHLLAGCVGMMLIMCGDGVEDRVRIGELLEIDRRMKGVDEWLRKEADAGVKRGLALGLKRR